MCEKVKQAIHVGRHVTDLMRVRCETEAKFTELLDAEGYSVERKAVKEVAYVAKKGSDAGDDNSQTGGSGNTPGGELEG